MPFSLNGCSLSSGCSSIEQKAAASYGLNRIQSYQVQLMSPDVTCPLDSCVPTFVRASKESSCLRESNSSKESCCIHESKEVQDCKTMQDMPNPEQCTKTPVENFATNPPCARSQCDPRTYRSLSIGAACPEVSLTMKQPHPTGSTGSNHIKSK